VGRWNFGGGPAGREVWHGHVGQRQYPRYAGSLRGILPEARTRAGRGIFPDRNTPSVTFVADDLDRAWSELGEYLLHDARSYAAWNPGNETSAGFSHVNTIAELRETSKSHVIIPTSKAIEWVRAGKMLTLSPLCGGLPPEVAWPYLKHVGEVVLPAVAAPAQAADPELDELLSNRKT
jgi:hypothetical protein